MKWLPLFIFFLPALVFAQFSDEELRQLDSLNALIANPGSHDTSVAAANIALCDILYYSNMDTVVTLSERAKKIADAGLENDPSPDVKRSFLISLSTAFNNIGVIYDDKGDIQQALEFYERSLEMSERLNDKGGQAETLNNMGIIYKNHGDIEKALKYYHKSLRIRTEIGSAFGIGQSLNNIALVHKAQGDIAQALEYYFKCLEIYKKIGRKGDLPTVLNNIGTAYRGLGDFKRAISYYEQSLQGYEERGSKNGIAISLNNLGDAHQRLGEVTKAVGYIERALVLLEETGNKDTKTASLQLIGVIYYEDGDLEMAKKYGNEVLELSRHLGSPRLISHGALLLKRIAVAERDFREALEMQELHIKMRDSIRNEVNQKASIRQQTKYEFEKAQLVEEQKEQEKSRKEKVKRERRDNLQYSAISIFLVILVVAMVLASSRKQSPLEGSGPKGPGVERLLEGLIFFSFLIFFEFLLVLADPYIEVWSGGAPGIKLLFNAGVAALIFPAHAFFEARLKRRLVKTEKAGSL